MISINWGRLLLLLLVGTVIGETYKFYTGYQFSSRIVCFLFGVTIAVLARPWYLNVR